MNYNEAMEYIKKIGNFGSSYGLERTRRLLELLGNPEKKLKLIHIAGTNGKGSTTCMITSLLMAEGFKVGMYTSPFLEEFEERIQINRENIKKDKLAYLMTEVKDAVERVIEEGFDHPTEFEIITCLMFKYFKEEEVDYGVIEVGLGGRLDSTNVITPLVSVITSISLDHTNLLGNTIKEIAKEKAGIIKEGVPVIIYPQSKEAYDVIYKKCKNLNSKLYEIKEDECRLLKIVNDRDIYQKVELNYNKNNIQVDLNLLGEHQILNAQVALKTVEVISNIEGFKLKEIESGFKNAVWNGRLEVLSMNPLTVIDGAHNLEGIKRLSDNIKKYFKYDKLYLLLGILADKQVDEMVREITPLSTEIVALTPNSERAELADELEKEIKKYNNDVISFKSYEEGYRYIKKKATKKDLILATGSLYMIGEMRGIIRKSLKGE